MRIKYCRIKFLLMTVSIGLLLGVKSFLLPQAATHSHSALPQPIPAAGHALKHIDGADKDVKFEKANKQGSFRPISGFSGRGCNVLALLPQKVIPVMLEGKSVFLTVATSTVQFRAEKTTSNVSPVLPLRSNYSLALPEVKKLLQTEQYFIDSRLRTDWQSRSAALTDEMHIEQSPPDELLPMTEGCLRQTSFFQYSQSYRSYSYSAWSDPGPEVSGTSIPTPLCERKPDRYAEPDPYPPIAASGIRDSKLHRLSSDAINIQKARTVPRSVSEFLAEDIFQTYTEKRYTLENRPVSIIECAVEIHRYRLDQSVDYLDNSFHITRTIEDVCVLESRTFSRFDGAPPECISSSRLSNVVSYQTTMFSSSQCGNGETDPVYRDSSAPANGRAENMFAFSTRRSEEFRLRTAIYRVPDLPEFDAQETDVPALFRTAATFPYAIARESRLRIKVYDLFGNEIHRLIDAMQTPRRYRVEWDDKPDGGVQTGDCRSLRQSIIPGTPNATITNALLISG